MRSRIDDILKRGDRRDDGMVFWAYAKTCINGEYWICEEKYKKKLIDSYNSSLKCVNNNYEKVLERNRIWGRNNSEKKYEITKNWHIKNSELLKNKRYERYHANREFYLEQRKIQRSRNIEKEREKVRTWFKNHPEYVAYISAKKRAQKRSCQILLDDIQIEIIKVIYETSRRVSICSGIKHHVDHIYPLSKGGLHTPSNLQILPAAINLRKGKKVYEK